MKHYIENNQVYFQVDANGNPTDLYNKEQEVNYIRPHHFWRLIIKDNDCIEIEAVPRDTPAEIRVENNIMTIRHTDIKERFSQKYLNLELMITVVLAADQLSCAISITNNHPEITVKEVHFPLLAIQEESISGVVTTYTGGQYFKDVKSKIMNAHTQFKGIDQYYIRDINCYPTNSMNCMVLDRQKEGLYVGCHDETAGMTAHILELDHNRDFNLVMAKFPYIRTGSTHVSNQFVLSPYNGSWHVAADKYRSWANCWYQIPERPKSIRETEGWQRIIMRTQYGRILFPYDDLQKPFEDAQAAGIDTLFLFGWHASGMDKGYPDYAFDEKQGGKAVLKKSIKEIQSQGGKIILYFNGQLIDQESDYFKEAGKRISTKLINGELEVQSYSFPGPGIFYGFFTGSGHLK